MKSDAELLGSMRESLRWQERADAVIPGRTQLLSKRPDQFSLGVWPGYYSQAQGSHVWDADGNRYLDMSIMGIGANTLGYANPDIDEAVRFAISRGSSSSLNCTEEVSLAEQLCQIHPWADQARFTRSGGEALAVAVRIVRATTGKDLIAFCGYHGWHDWYMSSNLGDSAQLDGHLIPGLEAHGVPRALKGSSFAFEYNNKDSLREVFDRFGHQIAAIVMEPMRSIEPCPDFLEDLMLVQQQYGVLLVLDEVSSGFRVNTGGAHLNYLFRPDLAVFAKALGNGYPIGAVIGTSSAMEGAAKSFISSTSWSERIGPAAALAVLQKYEADGVPSRLVECGLKVKAIWEASAHRSGLEIDTFGLGPSVSFKFKTHDPMASKAFFIQEMLRRGVLASNVFYASIAHTDEELGLYEKVLAEVFGSVSHHHEKGTTESALIGKKSNPGFARLVS